jgi:hypothetical protein
MKFAMSTTDVRIVAVDELPWHGFVNSGDGSLRQIDIHVSPSFDTEWREE